MSIQTLFQLPDSPDEFGVVLPPANLRRIDFSALEFPIIRRMVFEYIKTYYPDRFNDFKANNGIIMLSEIVSLIGSILSTRSDVIANEAFVSTVQSEEALTNHLELINQEIRRATPAVVDIEATVVNPIATEVRILAGTIFRVSGSDGQAVNYEIYSAPNDFVTPIIIPASKRGVVCYGIEGKFDNPYIANSTGGINQVIEIFVLDILDEPITMKVTSDTVVREWRRINSLSSALPNDEVFEIKFLEDGMQVITGDNNFGKVLDAGDVIEIKYRRGGGIRGRIEANAINRSDFINPQSPASAAVEVTFRNIGPSNGGMDKETIEQAKRRAPKEAATLMSATSGEDYAVLAKNFSHPVYGSVLKAVAILRTSLNANLVELYILASGPDDVPVLPSAGLKAGLISYFNDIKVLTDEIRSYDGAIKSIIVDATIVVDKDSNPSTVKLNVQAAINEFFDTSNFDLGEGLYVSNLYKAIQSVDGVRYLDIYEPADDILPTDVVASTDSTGIGFNELITSGQHNLRFYVESST